METRKCFVGGNWKCNGTRASVAELVEMYNRVAPFSDSVDVVVAPTALHIDFVLSHVSKSVKVAAQNAWTAPKGGAFTGELTVDLIKDFGLEWVILGHSERRHTVAAESSELVADKTKTALDAGLNVVLCIGETKEERDADRTMEVCIEQLTPVVRRLAPEDWHRVVIAYEPVWAIGTGITATSEQAQDAHHSIRRWLGEMEQPTGTRIVYGGSVNAGNCAELIACADIDGFLVGGASLKPEFVTIINAVAQSAKL